MSQSFYVNDLADNIISTLKLKKKKHVISSCSFHTKTTWYLELIVLLENKTKQNIAHLINISEVGNFEF